MCFEITVNSVDERRRIKSDLPFIFQEN